jgi:hypothetical protein
MWGVLSALFVLALWAMTALLRRSDAAFTAGQWVVYLTWLLWTLFGIAFVWTSLHRQDAPQLAGGMNGWSRRLRRAKPWCSDPATTGPEGTISRNAPELAPGIEKSRLLPFTRRARPPRRPRGRAALRRRGGDRGDGACPAVDSGVGHDNE